MSSHAYAPSLKVDTKLVEVAAVVRDSHGRVVPGLKKEDFRVLDDGKERSIDHFSIENGPSGELNEPKSAPAAAQSVISKPSAVIKQPRYLALFIDDVNSTDGSLAGGLKRTQTAAGKFVRGALKAEMRIGIFTASGAVKQDFTENEAKLEEAIGAIRAHTLMHEDGLTGCPRITPYLAYRIAYDRDRSALGAVVYDAGKRDCPTTRAAAFTQAEETWRRVKEITAQTLDSVGQVVDYLGTKPGKREMILASSGFLAVSMQEQKDQIIDRALRANVVVNALDSKGLYAEAPPGSRPEDAVGYPTGSARMARGAQNWTMFETVEMPMRLDTVDEPLANLAEGTGGLFYRNNNDLDAGFRKLGEPEAAYRLSFKADSAEGFHKLKITVKGDTVQARPGYLVAAEKETLQAKIDREMTLDDTLSQFPMQVSAVQEKVGVTVVVNVDISKLRFDKNGDRQVQRLSFVTALTDVRGRVVAAKESTMDFSLTEATFKRLAASGVNARVSFDVPAGAYKLRQVSEEALDGKMACVSHVIRVN